MKDRPLLEVFFIVLAAIVVMLFVLRVASLFYDIQQVR